MRMRLSVACIAIIEQKKLSGLSIHSPDPIYSFILMRILSVLYLLFDVFYQNRTVHLYQTVPASAILRP